MRTCAALKYLGPNISQPSSETILDQVNSMKSVEYIAKSNDRKKKRWMII